MAGTDGRPGDGARAFEVPDGLDSALAPLYENVATRLRTACAHMTPADFHALVLDIARMKLRWSGEHPAVTSPASPVGDSRPEAARQGSRESGPRS